MSSGVSDFFAMGGYAGFVWPAYALTFLVFLVLLGVSLKRLKTARGKLEALGDNARRRPRD